MAIQKLIAFITEIHHAYISIQSRQDGATKRARTSSKTSSETIQAVRPWTSSNDTMQLASASVSFRTMVENMRTVSRRYQNSPAISKILKPFARTLKQVSSTDDLALAFYKQTQILLSFIDSTYDANKIARLREANEFVPVNTIALAGCPEKLLALASELLKTPEMPYVFKNLLEFHGQKNIRMPLYFIARVHSDLDAFVQKQPLPSYYNDFPLYMADVMQPAISSSFASADEKPEPEPVADEDCVATQYKSPFDIDSAPTVSDEDCVETHMLPSPPLSPPITTDEDCVVAEPTNTTDEDCVVVEPTDTLESLTVDERAANLEIMPLVVRSATRLLKDYQPLATLETDRLNLEYNTMTNMLNTSLVISERGKERLDKYKKDQTQADKDAHLVGELGTLLDDMKKKEKDLRDRQERFYETSGFRAPKKQLIQMLPVAKSNATWDAVWADKNRILSTDVRGTPLKQHDFESLIRETAWLNDEIVNSVFGYLDRAINTAAGITDHKKQTRKCYTVSSLFISRLEADVKASISSFKRQGITKTNLLDVDTILLPICSRSHWTLLAILPSRRIITHIDPMLSVSDQRRITLAEGLLHAVLEERWNRAEWRVETIPAPRQTNGYDCGVFTITNGMCLALGINPAVAYTAGEMPEQRLRLAATLLNKGFTGDYDLSVF